MSDDATRLSGYVEVWWDAVGRFTALLDELEPDDWSTPTDLAGWDVKACVSHTAHLERVLAGHGEEDADVGEPPHVTSIMGLYTEIGVVNRRDVPPDDVVAELRAVAAERHAQLLADPPTDASVKPDTIFGGVPWTWETLLRNRPLDVWMHEQDVRRAVGRPGGLDSPAAQHTTDYLTESFGYVVAKKAGLPAGTIAVLDVAGSPTAAVEVDETGRGRRLPEVPVSADVVLRMDREPFICLAGGRRTPPDGAVAVEGDAALAQRVLDAMATTP